MGVRISKPKHFVPLNARVIIYNSLFLSIVFLHGATDVKE